MLGRKGGRAAKKGRRVWLLGRHHPGADRSLEWDGKFGNLSDPDVVIVDLTGLTDDTLQRIDKGNLDQAQASIWDKLLYGGTVVVVTQPEFSIRPGGPPTGRPAGAYGRADATGPHAYSNYHILPINIVTTTVQANSVIKAVDGHLFKGYIDAVKSYNFLISVDKELPPHSASEPPAKLRWLHDWDITDNSGRVLGLVLEVEELDHHGRLRQAPRPGHLVLLPPPTEPIGEAIGRILSVYGWTAPAGRPVAQPAQREKAAGPAPARNGDAAGRGPPLPAGGAGRGGAAGRGTAPLGGGGGGGPPPAAGGHARDAFLSYHHEAKDGVARPLAEGLEKRGVTVWWDSTAMWISDTLSDKIREGLNGARCGVVIVSKGYLDSGWGQTELGAMFLKNFPIFPVLYGVTAEEAQKKLPTLSGKIMRPWDDSPKSIMDEIASEIKRKCGHEDGGVRRSSTAPYQAVRGAASEIQDQLSELGRWRDKIQDHHRLLYAAGRDLESAVASALRAIGFAEARHTEKSDQADCIFDIGAGGYLHGLVEVKGADGRTRMRHIVRCAKWVDKAHEADGRLSKGIFVPNQHRSAEYPASTMDRLRFEPNELEYARMKDTCIIPSCVLFEAVKKALDGEALDGEALDGAEIAARIAGTRGVLERVF